MAVFTLLASEATYAQDFPDSQFFMSGNKLLAVCTDESTANVCTGYVIGVTDAMHWFQAAGIMVKADCPPNKLESKQIKDIVVEFLIAHPARRHVDAYSLASTAITEAFPCKK
jgi:Rap1a immunity proteins